MPGRLSPPFLNLTRHGHHHRNRGWASNESLMFPFNFDVANVRFLPFTRINCSRLSNTNAFQIPLFFVGLFLFFMFIISITAVIYITRHLRTRKRRMNWIYDPSPMGGQLIYFSLRIALTEYESVIMMLKWHTQRKLLQVQLQWKQHSVRMSGLEALWFRWTFTTISSCRMPVDMLSLSDTARTIAGPPFEEIWDFLSSIHHCFMHNQASSRRPYN